MVSLRSLGMLYCCWQKGVSEGREGRVGECTADRTPPVATRHRSPQGFLRARPSGGGADVSASEMKGVIPDPAAGHSPGGTLWAAGAARVFITQENGFSDPRTHDLALTTMFLI